MAGTMQYDLVSPERKLASGETVSVQIPGADGDMTALPNHAPFLTTLRPGILTVETASEKSDYVVTGGFVEISPDAISILAEQALQTGEVTREMLDGLVRETEEGLEAAADEARAAGLLRVNHLRALGQTLGL